MSIDESQKLPDGWRWVKLGDVCETSSGGTPTRGVTAYYGGSIPWIKSGELNDGLVTVSEETITDEGLASSSAKVFPAGTLMIAMYGATVGKLGILGMGAATNQAVCGIFVSEGLDRDYLFFWLLQKRQELIVTSFGGAQPNISQGIVNSIPLPLPPLPEQKRIAAILTEQMTAVEKARTAAEARLKAAKELPAAYLREVFESEEAQGWPQQRLGDVLYLRNDIVHPYDRPTGHATFVGLEHLQSGTGIRSGSVSVEMETLTGRKPKFYTGDIVYGYLRPYLNKLWIAEFDGLCSVDQYVYSVDGAQADTRYVAWYMRSPLYLQRAPIDTSPGQLPRIRKEEVASVPIELPPIQEQTRIVDQIETRMTVSFSLEENINEELDGINKMPAALLRQAFSGEL